MSMPRNIVKLLLAVLALGGCSRPSAAPEALDSADTCEIAEAVKAVQPLPFHGDDARVHGLAQTSDGTSVTRR